jgi:hypothetical protein
MLAGVGGQHGLENLTQLPSVYGRSWRISLKKSKLNDTENLASCSLDASIASVAPIQRSVVVFVRNDVVLKAFAADRRGPSWRRFAGGHGNTDITRRHRSLCLSLIRSGHIGDAVRPRLGDKECARRDRRRARPVHLSPGIDACGPHCNISCNRAAGDGGGAR